MAYILKQMYNMYSDLVVEYSSPHSDDILLVKHPLVIAAIIATYLYFVLSLGPRLMEKRKPFQIKNILIVYNAFQIVSNLFVWLYIIKATYYQGTFNLRCNDATSRLDTSESATHQVNASYMYFLLKLLDLLDTVFFILRKRFTHVSFLHVYHHAAMVFGGYVAVRFLPAGHGTMVGVLNCLVHGVMYGYYLVSAIDDNVKRSIWWKKYITQIQMIQFLLLGLHFGACLFTTDCTYPKTICFVMTIQAVFMLFMFGDFYRRAYLQKKQS